MTSGASPQPFKIESASVTEGLNSRHSEGPSEFFNILSYGVSPDTIEDSTAKIQLVIDACAESGGGTVIVPAGTYCVGTLWMRSRITLQLDAGAILLGIPDLDAYPVLASRWEGPLAIPSYTGLIMGEGLENIAITGRGKIDGNGSFWWDLSRRKQLAYFPSRLIRLVDCRNVLIEGIEINDSGAWAVVPTACDNVTISRVTIINPPDSPNTDGIDVDSCSNVHISDCHIDVGDDAIAIKSGKEDDLRENLRPCENITITNCTMLRGHSAVAFGSETSGSIRNVTISNCIFSGTDRGIRIKTRRGRGGVIEDISACNIIMNDVHCPIVVNLFYGCGAWDDARVRDRFLYPVDCFTPKVRGLRFSHIFARGAKTAAVFVLGLPEMPVMDLSFHDITIALDPHNTVAGAPVMAPNQEELCRAGMVIQYASCVRLRDVDVRDHIGPPFRITDSCDIRIANLADNAYGSDFSTIIPQQNVGSIGAVFSQDLHSSVIGVNADVVEKIVRKAGIS